LLDRQGTVQGRYIDFKSLETDIKKHLWSSHQSRFWRLWHCTCATTRQRCTVHGSVDCSRATWQHGLPRAQLRQTIRPIHPSPWCTNSCGMPTPLWQVWQRLPSHGEIATLQTWSWPQRGVWRGYRITDTPTYFLRLCTYARTPLVRRSRIRVYWQESPTDSSHFGQSSTPRWNSLKHPCHSRHHSEGIPKGYRRDTESDTGSRRVHKQYLRRLPTMPKSLPNGRTTK
jgi:hypothetical protein